MSYDEYLNWCRFRSKWGPLHVGMRVDRGIGRAIAYYLTANSKKSFAPGDFSPYDQLAVERAEADQEGTVENVFELLKGVANAG